jgi:hypothetical protein
MEWGRLHNQPDYKRVAEDTYGQFWISTVWLGLDHSFGSDPPLIFETMVFDQSDNDTSDLDCRRYATEAEALAGHEAVLEEMRKGVFCGYEDTPLDTTYEITEEPTLI